MTTPVLHEFAGPWALAEALAAAVARDLRESIAARGEATLVVSGGTTPRRFLETLSRQALDWPRVTVTLADERWVPPDHARSNERLVRDSLLHADASAAAFVPLYRPDVAGPDEAAAAVARDLAALPTPFAAVVLGMGNDAHCASLFPGGDHLEPALRPDGSALVLPMRAPAAEEPRITLTLAALRRTGAMYLHIEGAAKRSVLDRALAGAAPFEQAPIAQVLAHSAATPQVFYCP